jgi:hypothetical protein
LNPYPLGFPDYRAPALVAEFEVIGDNVERFNAFLSRVA